MHPNPHIGLVSHILSSYAINVLVAFICILKKYNTETPGLRIQSNSAALRISTNNKAGYWSR